MELHNRKVTLPVPRCPLCDSILTEAQLMWMENLRGQGQGGYCWHEVWYCHSCHSQHTFPARLAVLEYVRNSRLMPRGTKTLQQGDGIKIPSRF